MDVMVQPEVVSTGQTVASKSAVHDCFLPPFFSDRVFQFLATERLFDWFSLVL